MLNRCTLNQNALRRMVLSCPLDCPNFQLFAQGRKIYRGLSDRQRSHKYGNATNTEKDAHGQVLRRFFGGRRAQLAFGFHVNMIGKSTSNERCGQGPGRPARNTRVRTPADVFGSKQEAQSPVMKPVYQNRRGWRVRIAQAAIWLGAVFCLQLVFPMPPYPAYHVTDQIVAYVAAVLMVCAVLAFEIFLRLYVLRIERQGSVLFVTTFATLHHRHVRLDQDSLALGETRHEQASAFLTPGYDNYWRGLKPKGRLLPFIIDTTAPHDR